MKQSRRFSTILLGLGALLATTTTAAAQSYTYDEAGRLAGVSYADGSTITYSYDANGNLLERLATTPSNGVDGASNRSNGSNGSSLTVGSNLVTDQATLTVTTEETGLLLIEVLDIEGSPVRTIPIERVVSQPGERAWSVRWDGTDQQGDRVASGLYLVRLLASTGRMVADTRVMILR